MQSEPRIPPQIGTLARLRHRPESERPSANSHSMPEIRGEPSPRNVAIVLGLTCGFWWQVQDSNLGRLSSAIYRETATALATRL